MIHSMTGFGKGVIKSKYGTIAVELRALNHKFFEVSFKIPNGFAQFEDRLKSIIHQSVKRGKVYLNLELGGQKEGLPATTVNTEMARHYNRELTKLKRSLRLKGSVRLDQLILFPGVIVSEAPKLDLQRLIPYVKKALRKALDELLKDRAKEGRALRRDLSKRVKNIATIVDHIDERANISIVKYKTHLASMVRQLTGTKNVDKGRLEQEVALFAKNCDVSEELTRLKSHLVSFKNSLKSDGEVGKKLDFIAQELHREANTIASKSSDFKISKGVIQVKSDIEKIREQVKNVE